MKLTLTALLLIMTVGLWIGCGSAEKDEANSDKPILQNTSENTPESPQVRKIYLETMEAAIEEWGDRFEGLKSQVAAMPETARKPLEEPVALIGKAIDNLKQHYDRVSTAGDDDYADAKAELEKAMQEVQTDYAKAASLIK